MHHNLEIFTCDPLTTKSIRMKRLKQFWLSCMNFPVKCTFSQSSPNFISNLQNILGSASETCMWNLRSFREAKMFHEKMPTVPAIWNIMKFTHLLKVHQYCRIYWDQHLKPAFEVCALSEKLKCFMKKCGQCRLFEILWNLHIFSKFIKFHQTCRKYWDQHLKPAGDWEKLCGKPPPPPPPKEIGYSAQLCHFLSIKKQISYYTY